MPYDPFVTDDRRPLRFGPVYALTDRQATVGVEVVYYLRMPNGNIKIGTTRDMMRRLDKHRSKAGQIEPLAVEFGGRDLERERHEQFAHLRVGRFEHFRPESDLLEHIDSLRVRLGLSA